MAAEKTDEVGVREDKPNAAKFKTSPGAPNDGRETDTITFEVVGPTEYRLRFTAPDGKESHISSINLDGKERANNNITKSKFERIDQRHFRQTRASAKGANVIEWAVSPDGKSLTRTSSGIGSGTGRVVDDLYVYDKLPADNSGGTWLRDIAASKSKGNTTKSATMLIEPFPGGAKYTMRVEKFDGRIGTITYIVPFDGRPHPHTATTQSGDAIHFRDTVSSKQLDANTFDQILENSIERDFSHVVVSEDARTLTEIVRREYKDGRVFNTIYVYKKQ